MDRAPVTVPLQTGIKVVDALIPVGRGQRELILGDRQTGKTAIALDTIINQRDSGVICVYCAIGQRSSSVARVIDDLDQRHARQYSVFVVTTEDHPSGEQFAAPYAAMSIAEHFMQHGRDVLVVLDDLTKHARAYRELSLLLLPNDRRWLDQLQQEKWPTNMLPTFTMDADRLFSALVRQYLFVSLFRACAESLASEKASRLAAMRGAERNIGERIGELTSQFHQTRQMAITEELLDIAAGFEALADEL